MWLRHSIQEMKPWKKEALVCLACGVAIVGVLYGLGALGGGRFGPCGPSNDAALFLILAVLPGLPVMAILPLDSMDGPVGGGLMLVIIVSVAIIGYACLALTVRWVWSFLKSMRPRGD